MDEFDPPVSRQRVFSAREKAIRQLHVTLCAQARAQHGLGQASMPCGLVSRLKNIDLAYTYSIILVSRGRVHTMSPCRSRWCPRHDCARTHTHTHSHSHTDSRWADEYNMYLQPKGAMRTSHAGTMPLAPSLPVAPPAVLGAHTTRAPLLPPGQPGRLGRQGCPSPPPDHGKHRVRIFGRTNRSISYPWTLLRVAPLCVLSLR